jgi:hypothetical protein
VSGDKHYYLCEFRIDGRRLTSSGIPTTWMVLSSGVTAKSRRLPTSSACGRSVTRMPCSCLPIGQHCTILTGSPRGAAVRRRTRSIPRCSWTHGICSTTFAGGSPRSAACTALRLTAQTIYEKVFYANNLPTITPSGEHYEPEWSGWELEEMSRIFRLVSPSFAPAPKRDSGPDIAHASPCRVCYTTRCRSIFDSLRCRSPAGLPARCRCRYKLGTINERICC